MRAVLTSTFMSRASFEALPSSERVSFPTLRVALVDFYGNSGGALDTVFRVNVARAPSSRMYAVDMSCNPVRPLTSAIGMPRLGEDDNIRRLYYLSKLSGLTFGG